MARRILLADDSVTAQNMGRRILSDAGYDVVTVNNGSAALKKIAENKPDLIVLDVYMPGYGGLEVCQRIKEAPETTRIPVLLTVGKLEPFKPEEARRVGADAFIIKPFEATELLTALTRLEDKIVAGPQPQKSGRFAKALAALEQSEVAQRFGDRETGWKNRLTIPPPQFKPKETETEDTEAIASRSRDLEEGQIVKPAEPRQEFERPIPAGLPADITPEEIAAITAAAAAFGAKIEESSSPEAATTDAIAAGETVSSDTIANDLNATQPIDAEETEARSAPELREVSSAALTDADSQPSEGVSEAVGSSESAETENHPPATELPAVAPQAESETEAPAIAEAQKPAGSDAEVMAAIASLAPTNGHAIESMQAVPEGSYGIGQVVPNSPYSSGAAESSVTGPRWIAESVAVAVEESTLVLEHEMEQARAASAVLEAVNRRNESTSSTLSVASSVEPEISGDSGKAAVESVPTSISTDTGAVGSPPIGDSESATVNEEAAYAAAASAGSVADYAAPVESAPPTATSPQASEDESKTQSDVGTRRETELAAAWQNWKQIRESFVGSQPDSQVSEAASQALDTDQKETATSLNSETAAVAEQADDIEAAADTPAESTAIASIVDSMLAELRPKLVEEIAKKMNSEKREKEKKKKK